MKSPLFTRLIAPASAVLALALLATPACADDHGPRVALTARYVQECGACHTAFAPELLPQASWQRLMGGLKSHFGSDASLDAATTREIADWLASHAGQGKRARSEPAQDRITRAAWFEREHDEVSATVWQRPAIGSPGNCQACHINAAQGSFSEHDIRIPK